MDLGYPALLVSTAELLPEEAVVAITDVKENRNSNLPIGRMVGVAESTSSDFPDVAQPWRLIRTLRVIINWWVWEPTRLNGYRVRALCVGLVIR